MSLEKQDLFFSTSDHENLHVRFYPASTSLTHKRVPKVLFIHGAIENGRIFYSTSGKGLAPYLARNGFDSYVLDFRGRGLSTPRISKDTRHGQTELITIDLPTIIRALTTDSNSSTSPLVCIAHSWGGVLLLSTLARFPEFCPFISKIVFFGVKRSVRVQTFEKRIKIDLIWNQVSSLLTRIYGYLPAKQWSFGSDQESRLSHAHSKAWVLSKAWIDPVDQFNYGDAIQKINLPPILSVVGEKDLALGHPQDVKRFLTEAGAKHAETLQVPFGHVDMLSTHSARQHVFPEVLKWLESKH